MAESWFDKLRRALFGRRRPAPPPRRYPLPEDAKAELARTLSLLEEAGVLGPGEIAPDDAIDVAEREDIPGGDFYDAAHVLAFMAPLSNVAFFGDQVEVFEDDFVAMVREVARLAGREGVSDIVVRGVDGGDVSFARRGEFGPDNAVVSFTLDGARRQVPFLAFSKNLPIGLVERLADVIRRKDDPRRLYSAYNDQYGVLTCVTAAQAARLNAALGGDHDWFLRASERETPGAA